MTSAVSWLAVLGLATMFACCILLDVGLFGTNALDPFFYGSMILVVGTIIVGGLDLIWDWQ